MATFLAESELERLPRRARIAFAARCARRVQPLFESWRAASSEQRRAIDAAISAVQRFAAREIDSVPDEVIKAATSVAQNAAIVGTHATLAVAFTVVNAASSTAAYISGSESDLTEKVLRSVRYAEEASEGMANQAMEADHELVLLRAQAESWTDDTAISPEIFGPMWPDGEPEGWPSSGAS